MIKHRLSLDYTLAAGWMRPFVDGTLDGKAIGRQCISCDRISYPPTRSCGCGQTEGRWIALSGVAVIFFRATGTDGDFGLVRFEGADTHSVVKLQEIPTREKVGRIIKPESPLPEMILGPMPKGAKT